MIVRKNFYILGINDKAYLTGCQRLFSCFHMSLLSFASIPISTAKSRSVRRSSGHPLDFLGSVIYNNESQAVDVAVPHNPVNNDDE